MLRNFTNVVFLFILDFDGDNFLNKTDLERTLRCLTRNELTAEEVAFVVEKVIMSPPFRVVIHIVFPQASVWPSVCL